MTDTIVIGLGGKLRSGKDTVADYLASEHDFVKIGMSDALRDALYTLNPWIRLTPIERTWLNAISEFTKFNAFTKYRAIEDAVGYTEAKTISDVRRLLQVLGTEVGRQIISENVWVDIVERRIAEYRAQGRSVALTGVRFENEQSMIRRIGGTLVWIERPGLDTAEAHAAHASEQATGEDFDLTIANVGTLNDLYADVETLLSNLRELFAAEAVFDSGHWEDASYAVERATVTFMGQPALNSRFDHQDERPTAIEAFIERQARGDQQLGHWPHYDH